MAISFKRTHKAPPSKCKSFLLVFCVWISLCLIPLALLFEQTHSKTNFLKEVHHHHHHHQKQQKQQQQHQHSMKAIAPRHDTIESSSSSLAALMTETPGSDHNQILMPLASWSATNVSMGGPDMIMNDESNSSMVSPG
jgi:hypothetical protein